MACEITAPCGGQLIEDRAFGADWLGQARRWACLNGHSLYRVRCPHPSQPCALCGAANGTPGWVSLEVYTDRPVERGDVSRPAWCAWHQGPRPCPECSAISSTRRRRVLAGSERATHCRCGIPLKAGRLLWCSDRCAARWRYGKPTKVKRAVEA